MDEQKRRPKKSINRFAYLLVLVGLPAFNLGCMSHSFCQPYGLNRFLQKEPSVHERAAVHFGPPTLHGYHPTTWQLWPGTWVAEPVLGEEVEEIAPGPAPDEMPDEMGPPVDETAPAPMYPDPPMPSDFPLLPESPLLPLPEDDIDEQSMSPGNDEAIADQLVNHLRQQREQGDLRGFLIDLEVMEGTVKLEGYVTKPNHIKTISQIARDIPGVREVVMDVRISP